MEFSKRQPPTARNTVELKETVSHIERNATGVRPVAKGVQFRQPEAKLWRDGRKVTLRLSIPRNATVAGKRSREGYARPAGPQVLIHCECLHQMGDIQ